jgi:2-dehydropantoate 2-reductase
VSEGISLALVGAGSLGQAFSGLLAASGQAVTLLATSATAARLLEAGVIRLRGVVTLDVAVAPAPAPAGVVGMTADPARLPRGAGVIFASKGHQLGAAIAAVRAAWPAAGDGALGGRSQNGLAKDDRLAEAFAGAVVGTVTILGATARRRGGGGLGCTYLGELGGEPGGRASARVAAAVAALREAGIPAEAPADIRSALWSKACNAAGVFGVSVLTRTSGPRMFRDPDLIRAYLGLVRETAALAGVYGVPVGDYTNFPMRTYVSQPDEETVATLSKRGFPAPATGVESPPSMTQDLLAGRAPG